MVQRGVAKCKSLRPQGPSRANCVCAPIAEAFDKKFYWRPVASSQWNSKRLSEEFGGLSYCADETATGPAAFNRASLHFTEWKTGHKSCRKLSPPTGHSKRMPRLSQGLATLGGLVAEEGDFPTLGEIGNNRIVASHP
jgi:hypothetical protein